MTRKPTYEELEQQIKELEKEVAKSKHAKEALQETNEKLYGLIEAIPDIVYFKDAQGRHIAVNKANEELMGLGKEKIIGKTCEQLLSPDLAGQCRRSDEEIIRRREKIRAEEQMVDDKGNKLFFDTSKFPLFDDQGNITGLGGISRDITTRKRQEEALQKAHAELEQKVDQRTAELLTANKQLKQEIEVRKRAEEALKESEERFQQVADNAEEWIWEVDANGLYTYASSIVEKILGYKTEEIVGKKHFYDLFHPEDKETLKKAAFEIFAKKESFHIFINRNIHKNGNEIWLSTSGVPVIDKQGNLLGYRGADTNITESKRAEEALQASEKKYHDLYELMRLITDNVPDLIWAKDMDDRFVFANQAICDKLLMCGNPDKAVGKTDMFFAEQERKAAYEHTFGEICVNSDAVTKERKTPVRFLEEGLVRNEYLVLDVHKAPFLNEDGEMIGTVGCGRDVTQEKETERAQRESEEKYKTLAENSLTGVFIHQDKRFAFVSDRFAHIHGYTPEELLGEDYQTLIHPDEREAAAQKVAKRLKKEPVTQRYEVKRIKKDGTTVWCEMMATGIDYRERPAIMGNIIDITDRKQAEEELKKAELWMRSIFNSLGEAVLVVTPDRTLLNVNKATQKIFGYSPDELRSLSTEVLHVDHEHYLEFGRRINEAFDKGEPANFEFKLKRKNGEVFPTGHTLSLLKNDQGEPLGIVSVVRDNTEQKRNEELLREREETIRALLNATTDSVLLKDSNGTVLVMNSGGAERLGLPLDKIIGRCIYDFFPADVAAIRKAKTDVVFNSGKPIRFTDQRAGLYLENSIYPTFNSQGDVERVAVFGRDITGQIRIKMKSRRQTAILAAINRVFLEALTCESDQEVARTCLAVVEELTGSKFGFIGELNPAGLFDTIAISNPGWDACKMPDSESTRLIKNMKISGIDRSVLRDGKPRIVNEPASHPDRTGTPEGHPPITSFLGVPLKQGDRTIGMIGLANKESDYDLADQQAVEDLSLVFVEALERKRSEEALKLSSEELLKESNQRKVLSKRLIDLLEKDRHEIAMELHDHIGQVLTSLKINLEMIGSQLKPPNTELASQIKAAEQKTIQALRDIKSISHGLKPSVLDTLGLESSLRELFNEIQKGAKMQVHFFSRNVPHRFAREKELAVYRIAQEALTNILKHARATSAHVNLVKKDKVLSLSVEDDGVGFIQDEAMKISKGKGPLGLFIMRERVMQLGGELSIESQPGKGTLVLAEIPI